MTFALVFGSLQFPCLFRLVLFPLRFCCCNFYAFHCRHVDLSVKESAFPRCERKRFCCKQMSERAHERWSEYEEAMYKCLRDQGGVDRRGIGSVRTFWSEQLLSTGCAASGYCGPFSPLTLLCPSSLRSLSGIHRCCCCWYFWNRSVHT